MADIKEFQTWRTSQIFFKITNNAITFRVKAAVEVVVGLAVKPYVNCRYEVVIRPSGCMIKYDHTQKDVRMRNLISGEEFKEFWLTWINNTIILGRGATQILSMSNIKTNDYKYVGFSVKEDRTSAIWQLYLPPAIEKLPRRELEGGYPRWVELKYQFPGDAIIGGFENEYLYIIRAKHSDSLTPGKFVLSLGVGVICWGGNTHHYKDIEILCGHNHWWERARGGEVPAGAVLAGTSEDRDEPLYIGRVSYKSHLIVGKVQPTHRCCYIPFGDREISKEHYEVLVAPCDRRELVKRMDPGSYSYNFSHRTESDDE